MTDDSRGPLPSDSDDFLREIASAPAAEPAHPPVDLSGQTLGKYLVGARLGEGGMGVVYAATDTVLRRKVAIKVLSARLTRDAGARGRVLKEARSLAAVNHPGIALVYEVGEAAGHVYIAMELVSGKTLRQHLEAARAGGGLPLDEAKRIVADVARALEHAHGGGVVHRDLKPENVMVTDSGQVKILDFGLAKARAPDSDSGSGDRQTSTVEGHLVGTPGYMSPEQARGQPLDGRSDLFALGTVYYELVTGERAFKGASLVETLAAIERDTPPSPRAARPELSISHEHLIYRCLEKKPEARFQSARELLGALEARDPRPARRGGVALMGTLLGLGALSGGGAWWWSSSRPSNPLAVFDAVVACPQLAVKGMPEPGGWLGAAAAAAVCERVGTARWVQDRPAVLRPADLLGLSAVPRDDAPEDPYCADDARPRQLAFAREHAAAYVDGEVAYANQQYVVRLELKDASGATLARGEATRHALWQAVSAALEPLWGEGKIALPPRLPAAQAFFEGTSDPRRALILEDAASAGMSQTGFEEVPEKVKPMRDELGLRYPLFEYWTTRLRGDQPKGFVAPPLDRSTPQQLMLTASISQQLDAPIDYAKVADELHAASQGVEPVYRQGFAETEAQLRLKIGQSDAVSALILGTIAERGYTTAWYPLVMSRIGRPGFQAVAKAYAAWRPDIADAWNVMAVPPPTASGTAPLTLKYGERAMWLAPDSPLYAVNVAGQYIIAGRLDDARMLGSRLLTQGPRVQIAGEVVMLQVEGGEARFDAAYRRAVRVIPTRERFGSVFSGDEPLVRFGGEMAFVLGRRAEFAELVYRSLVATDPVRLDAGPWGASAVASICAFGEPKVALPCTARIKELSTNGYLNDLAPIHVAVIDASVAFARGQWAEAAAAVRRGGIETMYGGLTIEALDKAGDRELADRLLNPWLEHKGGFNGATFIHVRAARRALEAGDTARAKALAKRVVDAWTTADAPVPVLAEMRALLEKK